MKATVLRKEAAAEKGLDYRQITDIVQRFFAWEPGPVSSVVVRALSTVMRPLEQGSYGGRTLSGEPHRASWVIASPLNVFVFRDSISRYPRWSSTLL